MIYNLIEGIERGIGKPMASEKKMHTAFWIASNVTDFEVIACGGNTSFCTDFKNLVKKVTPRKDAIFLAYDVINDAALTNDDKLDTLRDISMHASVPCFIFKYECFEMALLRTGIPKYLLEYDKQRLESKDTDSIANRDRRTCLRCEDLISLIDEFINASNQHKLAIINKTQLKNKCNELPENHFNGSLEQIIKRTCELSTRCCKGCFKYTTGDIGTCWYEACDTIFNSNAPYMCRQFEWSSFNSPVCTRNCYSDKISEIFRVLKAKSVFDLYEPYNRLARSCNISSSNGGYTFTPSIPRFVDDSAGTEDQHGTEAGKTGFFT